MKDSFRPCVVVPTFDNERTLRAVVEKARTFLHEVIVVDDASAEPSRLAAMELAREGLAEVVRRGRNGGKGAAVMDGLRRGADLGFSHALQVDADGQHNLDDIPRFLDAARDNPSALVTGRPLFDGTAPKSRVVGRAISQLWTTLEMGGRAITDPLCGFRVYPIRLALDARARTRRMEFDVEVAVRMWWKGSPVVNLPTKVTYLPADEGGVSHYRLVQDNVLMSLMHARLVHEAPWRLLARTVHTGLR